MYHSSVYNVMIGAPSDVQEEVAAAINVINRWNYINSKSNNIVLIPLHWSLSSYPSSGVPPQKSINMQLVCKSDMMVAIFGTKIGTPTDTETSGTVEEIKEHLSAGKNVMIFFKQSTNSISSIDPQQLQKINDFKKNIGDRALWCVFLESSDFEILLYDKLQLFINDNWKDNQIPELFSPNSPRNLQLTNEERQRLIDWVKSEKAESTSFSVGNEFLYRVGLKDYQVKKGKENAEWDDFFKQLLNADLIEIETYNKSGRPIYKLNKSAYD